jgi:hypothetical protein
MSEGYRAPRTVGVIGMWFWWCRLFFAVLDALTTWAADLLTRAMMLTVP